jgi:hypothetical protein
MNFNSYDNALLYYNPVFQIILDKKPVFDGIEPLKAVQPASVVIYWKTSQKNIGQQQ